MKISVLKKYSENIGRAILCCVLSALFVALSACSGGRADKDISEIIEAWKTADQSQTSACRPFYTTDLLDKKQADTSKDCQDSYMEFLGTLNALRDYAKNNPSSRVEIRNTMYEIYGKKLYDSDKKDYLEAEGIAAIKKAVPLNDQMLVAELYMMMADLTSEEPLRSAIYDNKAVGILHKRGRLEEFYGKEDYARLSETFFKEEDYRDAIKYGNLWQNLPSDTTLTDGDMKIWDILGSSYMEQNQLDSSSMIFLKMREACHLLQDSTRWLNIASGKLALINAKWRQYSLAKDVLDDYLNYSLKSKDTSNIIYAYLGKSQVYLGTGEAKKAVSELKQARRFATTRRFSAQQAKVYEELERAFEEASLEDSASVCKRKLQMLEDKIQESRRNVELLKTKTEHELLQIQNDIDTVRQEKVSKRNWSWLIVLIVILSAIIVSLVWGRSKFRTRIHRRIARQHEEKQKAIATTELETMTAKLKEKGLLNQEELGDLSSAETWMEFRQKFAAANPNFFNNLDNALGKQATPAFEKVSALIYMGMDNSQISSLLNISKDSVARCKRRIRSNIGCEDLTKAISEM